MGFSSIRHIPVYVVTDITKPVAACSMAKARILIEKHAAKLQSINGRSGVIVSSADILMAHLSPLLQFLSPQEATESEAVSADLPSAPCHRPMNDREVAEHLVRAASLTASAQGGLDDKAVVEIRDIRQRLADAIPGMTFPRPTTGPLASRLNQLFLIFSQAQADRKLDDIGVIRQVQALTW